MKLRDSDGDKNKTTPCRLVMTGAESPRADRPPIILK